MSQETYDVIVIGAGSGGLTSAVGLAKTGKRVLLIEREHLGGECTNSGCIPSKALLHYAREYHTATKIAGITPHSETYRQQAFSYVRGKITETLADETPEHFTKLDIVVLQGEAVFTSHRSLSVSGVPYTFKKAIIATGSSPRLLSVDGLAPEHVLTNQNLFQSTTVPKRLLIVGAGPIGMEMGQALALLGSNVTILDNGPEFAKLEDPAIRPIIQKVFTDQGITILQNASLKKVVGEEALVEVTSAPGGTVETVSIPFDAVLVAIGRVPNLPEGLDVTQITHTDFGIEVDSSWRTTNKNIYALGDVAARLKFTHVADDTARQVVAHIVSKGLLRPREKQVPKVTYTEPEIGQVGLSWTDACNHYDEDSLHRIEVPLTGNDRARTDDATEGTLVVIAKRLSGKIVGAHMIGPRAGELIGTLTLAMEQNISLYKIRSTIFAYPTYSLLLKRAGDYFLAAQFASLKRDLIRIIKKALPKIIALCVWLIALLWLHDYQNTYGLTVSELALRLFEFITSTIWGPLLYILAYTVRPLTFFPGTALTVLSGVFFGLWGILYTIVGANLSATLAYFVGRFFSGDKKSSSSLLSTWSEPLRANPFIGILTMRLTFFPFDVVNYGAGLLRVPFAPYLLATILGTLLGIATFVSIGASLSVEEFIATGITTEAIDTTFIVLSVVIFIASLLVAKIVKKQ